MLSEFKIKRRRKPEKKKNASADGQKSNLITIATCTQREQTRKDETSCGQPD